MDLKKLKRKKVAAAIEADAGHPIAGLRESLAEAKAGKFAAVHTPAHSEATPVQRVFKGKVAAKAHA